DWTPPPARKPIILPQDFPPERPTTAATQPAASTQTATSLNPTTSPATAPALARRPVPDRSAQVRSRKLFKDVFAKELADRSASGRRALATKLLAEAEKSSDIAPDHFVLLIGATDAAREGNDLPLCLRASDQLANTY